MTISRQLLEFITKLCDSEKTEPKGLLRVRGEDGVVREFRGVAEWIVSLRNDTDEKEQLNSSAWMLRFVRDVERWLEDAQTFLDKWPPELGEQLPSALRVFLQTSAADNVLHPSNSWEIGARVFSWWRADVNFGLAEAKRMREEFQNRKLQAVLAEHEKRESELAAKSALENTQK